MPLYDFRCLNCKRTFTLVLSVKELEEKKHTCPKCKSKKVEEEITRVTVVTSKKS